MQKQYLSEETKESKPLKQKKLEEKPKLPKKVWQDKTSSKIAEAEPKILN